MPTPGNRAERMKGWNVNLYPSVWEELRRLAFAERTTISEQVRRAVDAYLGQRGRKAHPPKKGGR